MTDLNNHPLAPFFQLVAKEYERGLAKYGPWEKLPEWAQQDAVWKEYNEWYQATLRKDIDGEHGEE